MTRAEYAEKMVRVVWLARTGIPRYIHTSWTTHSRGFYRYSERRIYLPIALRRRGLPYITYYVAHEVAHAVLCHSKRRSTKSHGREFQKILRTLAGPHYHFEQRYQPKQFLASNMPTSQLARRKK